MEDAPLDTGFGPHGSPCPLNPATAIAHEDAGAAMRAMRHPQSLEFSVLARWHPITQASVHAMRMTHFLESHMPSMQAT